MKLEQLYYNPKSPAAYAGEQALYKLAKQSSKKVKLQDIRDWLRKQQTYTLHKPIRKKFLRRKTVEAGIDTQWQVVWQTYQNYQSSMTSIDIYFAS